MKNYSYSSDYKFDITYICHIERSEYILVLKTEIRSGFALGLLV